MNREQKRIQTRTEQAERFAKQTIEVDKNWRIIRFDVYNWQVQHKEHGTWCEYGFYGKLGPALQAVANKILSDESTGSLKDCVELLKAIRTCVDESLRSIREKVESEDIDPADLIDATEHQFGRRGEP